MRVMPYSRATAIASDDGAETAATIGIRAASAFCIISKETRPLTKSMCFSKGQIPLRRAYPITLSRALWRPTSSRRQINFPSRSNKPDECRPPVRSKTTCFSRSRSGSSKSNRLFTFNLLSIAENEHPIASIEVFPQMPQLEDTAL